MTQSALARGWERVSGDTRVQAARDDLGATLVDALAWTSDRLTDYAQGLADEAYLGGARSGLALPRRP